MIRERFGGEVADWIQSQPPTLRWSEDDDMAELVVGNHREVNLSIVWKDDEVGERGLLLSLDTAQQTQLREWLDAAKDFPSAPKGYCRCRKCEPEYHEST